MAETLVEPVAVMGAGAWGTALAIALARGGRPVRLWARDPGMAAALAADRQNARLLPGVPLPGGITPTADAAAALDGAGIVVAAVPTQAFGGFATGVDIAGRVAVLTQKGICRATGLLPHDLAAQVWPGARVVLLSGPSFAVDVARGLPTAVTVAGNDGAAGAVSAAFAETGLRPYRSADRTGVALGGAAKNVYAIACGIAVGHGLGESARAAVAARGFAELRRLGAAMGAGAETFMGLSGLGDLMLTCTSPVSRNLSFGLAVGGGADPARLMAAKTVEGAWTAAALVARAEAAGVEMPVAAAVRDVVAGTLTVPDALAALMARPLRDEG